MARINTLSVAVGNTANSNWLWNGFSLALENDLREHEWLGLS
jgi:hypothetical protein